MLTMIDTSSAAPEIQLEPLTDRTRKGWPGFLQPLALGIVMLISLFMNFYQLGQNGFGNLYYAAGVRSMLDNWHNFFFVSFDPGGFVTIDKPPLGFWLQVLSAKLFGFTAFSVYLPQALAGVLSVLLLYHLVRRHFGVVAGLLAALALAISPISVVTNRNNTIDSTLVLVMLLGAWAVLRAAETGKLRWLLLCAVFVGLGFNGIQRLLGVFGFGGRNAGNAGNTNGSSAQQFPPAGTGGGTFTGDFPQPAAGGSSQTPQGLGSGGGGGGGSGMFNTGNPGLLRLFNEPLGGQIVWLLPMALLGML